MCSLSIEVMTPPKDGSKEKLPSDSSVSTNIRSLLPNFVFDPYEFIIPPLITVGSNFALSKISAIKETVVVLP